jgi:hypothetical protein
MSADQLQLAVLGKLASGVVARRRGLWSWTPNLRAAEGSSMLPPFSVSAEGQHGRRCQSSSSLSCSGTSPPPAVPACAYPSWATCVAGTRGSLGFEPDGSSKLESAFTEPVDGALKGWNMGWCASKAGLSKGGGSGLLRGYDVVRERAASLASGAVATVNCLLLLDSDEVAKELLFSARDTTTALRRHSPGCICIMVHQYMPQGRVLGSWSRRPSAILARDWTATRLAAHSKTITT